MIPLKKQKKLFINTLQNFQYNYARKIIQNLIFNLILIQENKDIYVTDRTFKLSR